MLDDSHREAAVQTFRATSASSSPARLSKDVMRMTLQGEWRDDVQPIAAGRCSCRSRSARALVLALLEPQAPDSLRGVGILQRMLRAEGADGAVRGRACSPRRCSRRPASARGVRARAAATIRISPRTRRRGWNFSCAGTPRGMSNMRSTPSCGWRAHHSPARRSFNRRGASRGGNERHWPQDAPTSAIPRSVVAERASGGPGSTTGCLPRQPIRFLRP